MGRYGEGSEASMKGFAIKTSISEMVSLGEGMKVFLVEDCKGSTGATLDWCINTAWEGSEV